MGAAGPAFDASGNVYFPTGNGTFDGTTDFGESIVKLSPGAMNALDYFAPSDYATLNSQDLDFGSAGPTLLPGSSLMVQGIAGGYVLKTRPEFAVWTNKLFDQPKAPRLSQPALETLAVIAYRQPIGRAEIESVRGVAVDGVVATLLERKVIRVAGRSEQPGRPLLYETTPLFLELFGLKNLDELPNADELRRLQSPEIPHAPEQQQLDVGLVPADAAPAPASGPDRSQDAPTSPATD